MLSAGHCSHNQHFFHTVHIVLHPTPNTPIIKKKNFKVDSNYTIGQIVALIRKFINLDSSETLVSLT